MRVGLLGGSFNPAHEGHRHIAMLARRALRLDQVWLLVSPGNPLKPRDGMAPLEKRLAGARRIGDGRRVLASGIEAEFHTRYTVDTLGLLMRRFPRIQFVWIMGADILEQLPQWRRWQDIVRHLAIRGTAQPELHASGACRTRGASATGVAPAGARSGAAAGGLTRLGVSADAAE